MFDSQAAYHDELQKIQLPVVGRRECQKRMENTARFKGKGFRLHDSWMCIGGVEGKDTCKGDGGSPHVCKTDEGWTQVQSEIITNRSLYLLATGGSRGLGSGVRGGRARHLLLHS